MTDKDIIKALECCSSGDYKSCKKCPLFENCNTPIYQAEIIMKNALDLINRQKAENERLQDRYNRLCKHTEKIEFELGEKELDNSWFNNPNTHLIAPVTRKIKAEAIKEFAERLKKGFLALEYQANTTRKTLPIDFVKDQIKWVLQDVSVETIDNLVKEMVGEE